jgi:hypothetical protein
LDPEGGSFRWRGRSVPIDADRVFGIVFAAGVGREGEAPAVCALRDGSTWAGRIAGGDRETIRLELTSGPIAELRVADLAGIRFRSDRIVFVSDLKPVSYTFEPFGVTRWPYRLDRSVANRPMRLGERTFRCGVGVHSQATLEYELPEPFTHLAAVIGIDDAVRPRGNVVFRIVADGKEVFNSGPVTGRDEPRTILVPIEGARRLQLVVDFGEELDIGDQADWADARLIRR